MSAVGTAPPAAARQRRRVVVAELTGATLVQVASNGTAAVVATVLLGPADRGVMVLGVTAASIAAVAGGLGTGSALRSALPSCDRDARRAALVSYTWWLPATAVLAFVGAVAAAWVSAPLVDPALAAPAFLAAVGVSAVGQALVLQIGEAWFADGRPRRGGGSMALAGLCGLTALLAVAAAGEPTAARLLLAQGAGTGLAAALQLRGLRCAGLLAWARPRSRDVATLIRRGAPALGLTLGFALALRADRYILGAVAGAAAVGVYSLAATLGEMVRMVPQAIGQLYVRDVALRGNGTCAGIGRVVTASVGAAVCCGVGIAAAGWFVVVPLFGDAFAAAAGLLVILVVAEICFAPFVVASRGLIGGGWASTAGLLGAVAAAAAVVCYLTGARLAGSAGLAASCAVLYLLLSVLALWLFRRRAGGAR